MTATNEFRVRPVTRFNLTHFQSDDKTSGVRSLGEFDTVEKAEEVGMALNCLVPGSTFQTLDGRTAGEYPIGLLTQAIERDSVPPGHVAVSLADVESYFLSWEKNYRDGNTLSIEESLKMTPEQIAARNASDFWAKFNKQPTQYVIVAVHTFAVETKAYFANNLDEAQKLMAQAEAEHGTEFRIFSR
jgi:hypothetical protein